MAYATQDQKGFSGGQVTGAAIARLDNNYFYSCKELKNFIVMDDGSICPRDGATPMFTFRNVDEVLKIFDLDGMFLFLVRRGDVKKLIYKHKEGDGQTEIVFDDDGFNKVRTYGVNGEFPSSSDTFELANHGLGCHKPDTLENADISGGVVYAFFRDCFPFKIYKDGDVLKSAPYYYGGENEIWRCFPFNRTNENTGIRNMVFKQFSTDKFSSERKEDELLTLKVSNVDYTKGECDIRFDYPDKESDDWLDFDFASGNKFIGHPICFNIGQRHFDVPETNPNQWDPVIRDIMSRSSDRNRDILNRVQPTINEDQDNNTKNDFTSINKSINGIPNEDIFPWKNNKVYFLAGNEIRVADYSIDGTPNVKKVMDLPTGTYNVRRYWYKAPGDGYYFESKTIKPTRLLFADGTRFLLQSVRIEPWDSSENAHRSKIMLFSYNGTGWETKIISPIFYRGAMLDGGTFYAYNYSPYARNSKTEITPYNINTLEEGNVIRTNRRGEAFRYMGKYYITEGKFLYEYSSSLQLNKTYLLERAVRRFDGEKFYTTDDSRLYISKPLPKNPSSPTSSELTEYTPPEDAETESSLRKRESDLQDDLDSLNINQAFTAMGFRFFCVFPYQLVHGDDGDKLENDNRIGKKVMQTDFYADTKKPRVRCKFYSLGVNPRAFGFNDSFGGQVLDPQNIEDETDNFIVSDWYEGFPHIANRLSGKDFLLTKGGKISGSHVRNKEYFGHPIKALINSSGFDYRVNRVKYEDILPEDFLNPSTFLERYLQNIEDGTESILFNLGDAFTYVMRDVRGIRPDITANHLSDIGAFTVAGAQNISFTNLGVFYWGVNNRLQADDVQTAFNIGKVSSFIGGSVYKGIIDIKNRLYVCDDLGELYFVEYDQTNRNFVPQLAARDIDLNNVNSMVNFIGDRLLGIDSKTERMFCCNTTPRGELIGASEFTFKDTDNTPLKPKLVFRTKDQYYFVMKKGASFSLWKYGGGAKNFEAIGETNPLTIGKGGGMHALTSEKLVTKFVIFGRDIKDIEFEVRPSEFVSLLKYKQDGTTEVSPIEEVQYEALNINIPYGYGVRFKVKGTDGGNISGISTYFDLSEEG